MSPNTPTVATYLPDGDPNIERLGQLTSQARSEMSIPQTPGGRARYALLSELVQKASDCRRDHAQHPDRLAAIDAGLLRELQSAQARLDLDTKAVAPAQEARATAAVREQRVAAGLSAVEAEIAAINAANEAALSAAQAALLEGVAAGDDAEVKARQRKLQSVIADVEKSGPAKQSLEAQRSMFVDALSKARQVLKDAETAVDEAAADVRRAEAKVCGLHYCRQVVALMGSAVQFVRAAELAGVESLTSLARHKLTLPVPRPEHPLFAGLVGPETCVCGSRGCVRHGARARLPQHRRGACRVRSGGAVQRARF
ncbi:MAG: hypothetical protein IPG93_24715 [Burkholderiales bacterium]|nr:hypothetical protein [Burkholderiales bacterium]